MRRRVLSLSILALSACQPDYEIGPQEPPDDDTDADPDTMQDTGMSTTPMPTTDPEPTTQSPTDPSGDDPTGTTGDVDMLCSDQVDDGCGDDEVCGPNGSGNGLDDDCNGTVDDGCGCTPGDVRPCFDGPPGRRDVGACEDGTMRCEGDSTGSWGACEGGISPRREVCDELDNDCDGCPEDAEACDAEVTLACPGPGELEDGSPFAPYVLDGTAFYDGAVQSWSWTVTGGPCDELLFETAGKTSYTLVGTSTSELTFTPTLSGDYTVELVVVAPDGTFYSCKFIVHVRAPGLRVELCWDTTGTTDLDLHLHRPGTTTAWDDGNPDDCGYSTCRAADYTFDGAGADWGLPNSDLAACSGTADGGIWTSIGHCANPRLDIDNINMLGVPENINVDTPQDGGTHRIMVHHYSGSVTTHPMVNVYCGGTLVSTHGAGPDFVEGFDDGDAAYSAPRWRVADVTTTIVDGETVCDVQALHPPGEKTGAWVDIGNDAY